MTVPKSSPEAVESLEAAGSVLRDCGAYTLFAEDGQDLHEALNLVARVVGRLRIRGNDSARRR